MKKSDHSKLANNSFLTFQGTTYGIVCLTARCFLYQVTTSCKGPIELITSCFGVHAVLYQPISGVCKSCIYFPSKNRGKDWDSNVELIPRETKLVSQSKWKLLKFDKYVFLANCSIAPLPTFSENAALYIISTRPGAKGHEEGMFTCTYVYIRIPNVHFLII